MRILKHPLFVAVSILIAANIALFWKFYFKGLFPFPGDLLVSYYFPWSSGGFIGFDPWTTRKDVIAMDVIRQMYPWKDLVVDQIKSGQWPLWNPYNFSGTPLLANMQSSVFFPGNFVFFLLPKIWAWISLVVSLPLIFSFFSYLFLRSLKLSSLAAVFGAIVLSNLSYIVVWAEQLVVIQSVLFLPLALWAINKNRYWLLPLFLAFSVFGGHIQTTLYVYIITSAYLLFKKVPFKYLVTVIILAIGLSAIQLLPSVELYLHSAREGPASRELFYQSTFPWQNLVTIIAPDFFGNPATNNFRGRDYGNFQGYFGVVAFILALLALKNLRDNRDLRFWFMLGALGLLFSLAPFAYIFDWLHAPILSSGYPSRMVFIFQFCFAVLAAYGFHSLQEKTKLKNLLLLAVPLLFLLILYFTPNKRNLILPGGLIFLSLFVLKFPRMFFLLIAAAILEYAYFFNKYQPFSPGKFVFPKHTVFQFLQTTAGIDRFFGYDRAYVDSNFSTYYRTYSPEGYDPLYIRRYGELLASSEDGKLPSIVARSDAFVGKTDNLNRHKLFDLIGVKYALDKTDEPAKDWGPNHEKFPADRFNFIKQYNKWKFYERKSVLPRAFLAGSYQLETNPQKTIETFYTPDFNPKTLILEKKPLIEPFPDNSGHADIVIYTPNRVVINTNSLTPKLLFLSDNHYPGWIVTTDGKESSMLKADYTFRAISVPGGEHQVVYTYDPLSFKFGIIISILSLLGWQLFPKTKR